MNFSIIIPYRELDDYRDVVLSFLMSYYITSFPEAEIILGRDMSKGEEFSRASAINNGVIRCKYDALVIADADVLIREETLMRGLNALDNVPFVIPWGRCIDISRRDSFSIINGKRIDYDKYLKHPASVRDIRPGKAYKGFDKCAGGLQVVNKSFFMDIGGYESRFQGWGYEDTHFCFKVKKAVGDYPIFEDDFIFHLWHPVIQKNQAEWHKNAELFEQLIKEMDIQ